MTGRKTIYKVTALVFAIASLILCIYVGARWEQGSKEYEQETATRVEAASKPKLANPEEYLLLVNEERAKAGVQPLVLDRTLNTTAKIKADDMISKGYYNHDAPDGKKWYELIRENRPENTELGENLDRCAMNAQEDIEAWVNSPTHYQGMIDSTVIYFGSYATIDPSDGCMLVVNQFSS